MSKQVYTVTKEGLEYLCGLINQTVSLPSELISDITLSTNKTMSSVKIDKIIKQCLQDANEYSNEVVNSLTHLVAEKIDFEPTLDNTTDKINTLLLYSVNSDNNYTQYLRLTNELLNLGDTSLSLNEYMKEVDADTKYTLKTTTDTLTTEVTNIKTDLTTHTDDTDVHITADERIKWNNATKEEKVKEIVDSEMTVKGVCTTKVADVPKTIITPSEDTKISLNTNCTYTVINGICYVSLWGFQIATAGQHLLSTSLPKSKVASLSMCSYGTEGNFGGCLFIRGYNSSLYVEANKTNELLYGGFSYPVAES